MRTNTCFLAVLLTTATAAWAEPIQIGDRRQVFIDQTFIADSKNVELRVHPPRKSGEMNIKPDRPWEVGGIGPYSSVLWENGTYHAWYHAMDNIQWDTGHTNGSVCYARSKDGITWEKPDVGLVEYKGDPKNNIVFGHRANGVILGQDAGMVFLDPNAPHDERFRMACRFGPKGEGIRLYSSGDGVHWKLTHPSVIRQRKDEKLSHLDSMNVIFWDDAIKKYVAYVRYNRPETRGRARSVSRAESATLDGFPVVQDMQVVLQPDEKDLKQDGLPIVDFYTSAAVKYPWAENAYFMFPTSYYHYTGALPEFRKEGPANAGPLDCQFGASRDGVKWERYDREPFVPLGMKGEFDWGCARVIWGLVPDTTGREMYIYYRAGEWLHGWDRDERNKRILTEKGLGAERDITCISRLISRRDGFTSIRGAYTGGEFTTPALVFSGKRLVINVNTSATGLVRVELQNGDGTPIDGFGAKDCDLIHTANEINRVVKWKGSENVGALAGKPVRVRFLLHNADLHAFQFPNE